MKVAHHGSEYSTGNEFLKMVSPAYAVISCEADNSYGHPHKETIGRLTDSGAATLQTPKSGAVTVLTDGESMKIKGWVR